ncbi:MAG: alanyl-tRNA editing protein [Acidobacteria bacterium]|nr:alanyl-tRNA editing protein [Acidobacteriota bacterium]
MTDRLYYHDAQLTAFTAQVVDASADRCRVYLDRSAFYPASGGQPSDRGLLGGIDVVDVIDEEDRVAHVLAAPLNASVVEGTVAWTRRHDHMQQHTGQHLLSAVLEELYAIPTLSFHMGAEVSDIEIGTATLNTEQIANVERRVNDVVSQNRAVSVAFEDAATAQGLRKPSERPGILRIVSIDGLDRSACGGTHVSSTAAIGPVFLRKLDRVRGNVRLEFVCGHRALRAARGDYERLAEVARLLSASPEEVPELVASLQGKAATAEKANRKLAIELASLQGRQLYESTQADASGIRRYTRSEAVAAISDETRTLAQSFTAGSKAIFLAVAEQGRAVLLAASKDSGRNAGDILKQCLQAAGGRGGGNPQLAQGSVPAPEALAQLLELLKDRLG